MSDRSPPASRNGSANAERAHRMVERFFDILKLLSYSAAIIQLQWTYATLVSLRPTNLDAERDGDGAERLVKTATSHSNQRTGNVRKPKPSRLPDARTGIATPSPGSEGLVLNKATHSCTRRQPGLSASLKRSPCLHVECTRCRTPSCGPSGLPRPQIAVPTPPTYPPPHRSAGGGRRATRFGSVSCRRVRGTRAALVGRRLRRLGL